MGSVGLPPRLALAVALCVSPGLAGPARATAVDWFGLGSRASAMGTGGVALADGLAALLVNPALMVLSPEGWWIGMLASADLLEVTLDPRPEGGYDVPASIYQSSVARTSSGQVVDRPLATADLMNPRADTTDVPNAFGVHLGLTESFGLPQLRFGLAVSLPLDAVQAASPHYSDEREQFFSNRLHFARFGEVPSGQLILFGLAWRAGPFAFGISSTLDATARTISRVYVPEGSVQNYSMIVADIGVLSRFRYTVGAAWTPIEGLTIALAQREPTYLEATGEGRLQLWNYDDYPESLREIVQSYRFVLGYFPRQVSLGASWARATWLVHADATWEEWSAYLDSHGERPEPGFDDVFSVRAGGEWTYLPSLTARLGIAWMPTPVPAQTGRTNYVDNDLLALTAGHGISFEWLGATVAVELALQAWHMPSRRVYKDPGAVRDEFPDGSTDLRTGALLPESDGLQTNNPGFPGWEAGGWTFVGSLTFGITG